MSKVRVTCIQCPECLDILYSRARHDFHGCTCGKVFIDGGFDYTRIGGDLKGGKPFIKYIMEVTRKDLYHDWNKTINKYGRIKTKKRKFPLKEIVKIIGIRILRLGKFNIPLYKKEIPFKQINNEVKFKKSYLVNRILGWRFRTIYTQNPEVKIKEVKNV